MPPAERIRWSGEDARRCVATLRHGSRSFYAASHLLPVRLRTALAATYAFCRDADDLIDEQGATADHRLDAIYRGSPDNRASDRSFASVVDHYGIPRAIPDALIEGFAWEVDHRTYDTLGDVLAYSARVASSVGVMACLILGRREAATLHRACELGAAMQLTNISRDVGEDARLGRCYLPRQWMAWRGVDVDAWLRAPTLTPGIRDTVEHLLLVAESYYRRAELGIAALPRAARPAIWAARLIYADIGRVIRNNRFDSMTRRARTPGSRKVQLAGQAVWNALAPPSSNLEVDPTPEFDFLVRAVTDTPPPSARRAA